MFWDDLGKTLKTNDVMVDSEKVIKHYRAVSVPMAWAVLERKRGQSPAERYEREKRLIGVFYARGLNTPELLGHEDKKLTLVWRTVEVNLEALVSVFSKSSVHVDDKRELYVHALRQLKGIHDAGESHGDPYLKNFFRPSKPNERGPVYTCDFEHERCAPDPQVYDILLLAANAAEFLGFSESVLGINQVYGSISKSFEFNGKDRWFFSRRFGAGDDFFRYFSSH